MVDWTKQNVSSTNGFPFKKTLSSVTKGVVMWSEIFTHDYSNGTKIAIILWDTQGLSHSKTDSKHVAVVSALTTVLSSVQCFNLERRFDQLFQLHYFELFYKYAEIALQSNVTKPFKNLIFIVRDFGYPSEMELGWHDLKDFESGGQTEEFAKTLARLRAAFEDIQVFLMPHPGPVVDEANYTGDVSHIDPKFIKELKVLIPRLLKSESLVIQKDNGLKVRDLVNSIEILYAPYAKNIDLLPETLLKVSKYFLHRSTRAEEKSDGTIWHRE